ncbi:ATP-binding protein [Streptomyces sp. SCL15-4]|uniref:ATP-binding protein n=1 Tax=Streptomyces sp. SCL15-4 TaxID=2967221 RepID=UPI002966D6A8|nr:ATP-binding protein [Streptomyces sp. SCL15-4]
MEITVGEHSVRRIRRIVRSLLCEWSPEPLTFAVELGVSELVTNVVRHVPDRRCRVVVAREASGVRAEVTDGHAALPHLEGGRGPALLDAVVDTWGVSPSAGGGKTVWFECHGAPTASGDELSR